MRRLLRHPALGLLLAAALAVLMVVGLTFLAVYRAAHVDDAARIEKVDVILVLGAAQYGGTPSPVFAGRLDQAALLYGEGRATTVVVLGGNQPGDTSTEAQAGYAYLVAKGVPAAAVVAEPEGTTTLESLRAAAIYMKANGMESAFLVSDPWHNLRIKRMAGDLGIEGYVSATWHSAAVSEGPRFSGYLRETFAYLYYRIFGR